MRHDDDLPIISGPTRRWDICATEAAQRDEDMLVLSGRHCRRCNRPLDHDGYGDSVGGAHYACARNEQEMWSRR